MAAKTQKPKLLIIDDEEPIRGLLIDLLGGDYDCSDAGSAEEALTALADETFDLVISDIDMGGMSGLELVPRVHSLSPDTVVVMISGNSDIEFAIEALRVGAFDCAFCSSRSKEGMPEAARVLRGPGAIACTRMPFGPSSAAMYRVADSSAAFTGPIML